MLTKGEVVDLTGLFQEYPEELVCLEAVRYSQQFKEESTFGIFCAGISSVALCTEDRYYKQLARALFDIGVQQGLDIYKLMPWHVPDDGIRNHIYSVREVSERVKSLKEEGQKVGFLHGHFRILTPASFANVLVAQERCDHLVLGMEDGWRTECFKGSIPFLRDWERWQLVLASGFSGSVCSIRRWGYTDSSYGGILRTISPDTYFSNESYSEEVRGAMEERAIKNGIEFIVLPKQEGFHTRDYFG